MRLTRTQAGALMRLCPELAMKKEKPVPKKKKNQLQHTGVNAGIRPAHQAQDVLKVTFSPNEIRY